MFTGCNGPKLHLLAVHFSCEFSRGFPILWCPENIINIVSLCKAGVRVFFEASVETFGWKPHGRKDNFSPWNFPSLIEKCSSCFNIKSSNSCRIPSKIRFTRHLQGHKNKQWQCFSDLADEFQGCLRNRLVSAWKSLPDCIFCTSQRNALNRS